ncbi:MAG: penicillin-binding protein [Coriobacteriales bacterium]|jgi:penicillin-binding protein 1A|nr:penicillin-binding protein [Coriobacteriales bacterium]
MAKRRTRDDNERTQAIPLSRAGRRARSRAQQSAGHAALGKLKDPHHPLRTFIIVLLVIAALLLAIGVAGGVYIATNWLNNLPDISNMQQFYAAKKTTVYADDGTTVIAQFSANDRQPVSADQIAPSLFNATVAVEDERYWQHGGVDIYGIVRAGLNNLTGGSTQGGSTIAQQLIRQTVLSGEATEMTLKRKVREAVLAIQMSQVYSKEDILLMYVNTINYGDGSWGIQSASLHYFSKPASELNIAQAALLAGIPQSPTYNNPVKYPKQALARRNAVLDRMYANNMISADQLKAAKASKLGLKVTKHSSGGFYQAPYFTSYIRDILVKKYGSNEVYNGGLTVYSTLSLPMQQAAEKACTQQEANLPEGVEASLSCVDPATGYIKCLRGGKDYAKQQFSTCTDMHRQAGSSFKPFCLTACIAAGISPSTLVSGSSPAQIGTWNVSNDSGENFGTIDLKTATTYSVNTAYARICDTIGPQKVVDMAHKLGITSKLQAVDSVVLGTSGVDSLEMASAYATLADQGTYNPPTPMTKVLNSSGQIIWSYTPAPVQAVSPQVAYAVTQVLETVPEYGTGTQARLYNGQVSAGKTGTTSNGYDSWYCGYTPQLACAVWVGARKQRQLPSNYGGSNCAPIWHNFMTSALAGTPVQDFAVQKAPPYNSKVDFLDRDYTKSKATGGNTPKAKVE